MMITREMLIKSIPKQYHYDKDSGNILDSDNFEIMSLDDLLSKYRKENGESFESVYSESMTLVNVIVCTECKAMIVTYEDERYDPHFKCPICTDYTTDFQVLSKNSNVGYNGFLYEMYIRLGKEQDEQNERIERRKGLQDWQLFKKEKYTKDKHYTIELLCDNIVESRIKGLRLELNFGKSIDGAHYTSDDKTIIIPLGITYIIRRIGFRKNRKLDNVK